jgi:predicted O-linked N-acetylglucosamine transferase (SPINDLY family)
VQISLHDAATSGIDEMDYIIGDRRLIPGGGGEIFVERPLRLPVFYLADPPDAFPPLPAERPAGPPVFGCFTNPAKIGPGTLALWGRLLAAVPEARLLLKYRDFYASDDVRLRFAGHLTRHGARAEQIVFETVREDLAALLARFTAMDVLLDTAPFSGSTATFQALGMGVPVVTLAQTRMVGRWSAAILGALGLEDWIADGPESYIAIAARLARDPDLWAGRQALRDRLAASSLCDGEGWARRMERLYRSVWRRAVMTRPAL